MKLRCVVFAGFLAFFLVPARAQVNQAKPLTAFEQTLITAEKSLIDAQRKGGADFFRQTLSDDFSLVDIDGETKGRQESLDQFADGGMQVQPYNIKVVTVSDSAGIVSYDAVVRVPPEQDQGPPPRYRHISSLWVKQGEQWKLKFQQLTAKHYGDW